MTDKHDHDEIDCTIAIEQFYAYLDKELSDEQDVTQFEQHISHCKSCFSRLQLEQALSKRMREAETKDLPTPLKHRLKGLIDSF